MTEISSIFDSCSEACEISPRTLKKHLAEIGLGVLIDEARRMQFSEAYQEKRLLGQDEPIPARLVKQAYENIT